MTASLPAFCTGLLNAALDLIYPPVCQICHDERAGIGEGYVGGKCWSQVRFITAPYCERCGLPYEGAISHAFVCSNCHDVPLHFKFARSGVLANQIVLQVIHRYKYNYGLYFEPFLVDLLLRQAVPALASEEWDWIVPVPLHPTKLREREFNQAERLARHLSRATAIPLASKLVQRIKPTETQTHLNREQRAGNVQNAFAPRPGVKLNGQRVVLIDDVMTTGATTSACAHALRKAGAQEVGVWTVARGA